MTDPSVAYAAHVAQALDRLDRPPVPPLPGQIPLDDVLDEDDVCRACGRPKVRSDEAGSWPVTTEPRDTSTHPAADG